MAWAGIQAAVRGRGLLLRASGGCGPVRDLFIDAGQQFPILGREVLTRDSLELLPKPDEERQPKGKGHRCDAEDDLVLGFHGYDPILKRSQIFVQRLKRLIDFVDCGLEIGGVLFDADNALALCR